MDWWIWCAGGVALFGVEMLTPGGFYFFFFGVGAFAAGVASAFGVDGLLTQSLLFGAVSVASMVFLRDPLRQRFAPGDKSVDVDALVGQTALLAAELHPGEFGQAELRGTNWKVRNIGSVSLAAGQRCIVEQVDGLTLHVRAAQ